MIKLRTIVFHSKLVVRESSIAQNLLVQIVDAALLVSQKDVLLLVEQYSSEIAEVSLIVNHLLELLEGELIAAEHLPDHLSVEVNLVLAEEVNELPNVECTGAIAVKLLEDLLHQLVLLDLLLRHEILFGYF